MSASAAPAAAQLLEASVPPEYRGIARDEVRMLVTDRATGTHVDARFPALPSFLRAGDLLVVNDSATLPAALEATRADNSGLMLHVSTAIDSRLWTVEPRGYVRSGEELRLPGGGSAVLIAPVEPQRPRLWYARFQIPAPMHAYLMRCGEPIRYAYVKQRFPLSAYQTVFAREPGSSEMPSAGRPFTTRILDALQARGVDVARITLHAGVASFEAPERPGAERYTVSPQTASAVNLAREQGRRIVAVGTTVVRALESAGVHGETVASSGWTDLVIDASHRVQSVDALLTGFHDRAATHQWMLRAFAPQHMLDAAYAQAAADGYYQHEFGDVHLIV